MCSSRALTLVILLCMTSFLMFMGRVFWCPAGDLALWSFEIKSQHNSQHILDWYTPSHISHGFIFYFFFQLILPDRYKSYALTGAVFLESSWEVLENSSFIINRYREATLALNYYGDSIANSLADVFWCISGFYIAKKLNFWKTTLLFILFELSTLYFIRDNLILNIIMLIYPLDAIKSWQMS